MSAKIATALHEIMSKVAYVQRTGKNAFHGYKYAGEADLLEKLRPAMVEAGLMLLPSVKSVAPIDEHGNVLVQMEYTLIHKDGDVWPEKIGAAGMGNDRAKNGSVGDKGVYKAITGANKYVLFKLFQIETGDDPEVDSQHDKASNESYDAPPRKANGLPEVGWREDGSRTSFWLKNNGTLEDLKAQLYDDAVDCHTLRQLEGLKDFYRGKARELKLNKQFLQVLTEEFSAIERNIMEQMDAAELAEVPLEDALAQSLAQHPIRAG